MKKYCAYCGDEIDNGDKEHVFPKCLYPLSKAKSTVQRLTVPACNRCNNSWSDDEAHFRNVLVIAGDNPNPVRQELWEGAIARSFEEIDGNRRIGDLLSLMIPVKIESGKRFKIYPAKDERVLKVVRKIIRGLCHHHELVSPVSDQRVWADFPRYTIPQKYIDIMIYQHRESDIAEYRFATMEEPPIHSVWLLTFFQQVKFIGLVSTDELGFQHLNGKA